MMLELARDRTAAVHSYLVTAEHTAEARERMGPDALLAPGQAVVLEKFPRKGPVPGFMPMGGRNWPLWRWKTLEIEVWCG
jgi:hypothetical protein